MDSVQLGALFCFQLPHEHKQQEALFIIFKENC